MAGLDLSKCSFANFVLFLSEKKFKDNIQVKSQKTKFQMKDMIVLTEKWVQNDCKLDSHPPHVHMKSYLC